MLPRLLLLYEIQRTRERQRSHSSSTTDAPEATILQPVVDGVKYENEIIAFEGVLSDTEDVVTDLEAYWVSSVDGVQQLDAVPNPTERLLATKLSEGEHIIELHVEDTTGKVNKDSLVIDVSANSAPTCSLTQPTNNLREPGRGCGNVSGLVGDVMFRPINVGIMELRTRMVCWYICSQCIWRCNISL